MSHLHFNEGGDYFEKNRCENEAFCSTIFHHKRKLHIHTSAADLLHTVLE